MLVSETLREALWFEMNPRPCPVKCIAYLTGVKDSAQKNSETLRPLRELKGPFRVTLIGETENLPKTALSKNRQKIVSGSYKLSEAKAKSRFAPFY